MKLTSALRLKLLNKRTGYIFIGISVVAVLAVLGSMYYLQKTNKTAIVLSSNESVPAQISRLDKNQVAELTTGEVDVNSDFNKAYAQAFALAQQGDYRIAASHYAVIVSSGKATHEIYVEYAAALYYSGDKQGGVRAMETAVQKVSNDTKLKQVEKDAILRIYNNQLVTYRDEVH